MNFEELKAGKIISYTGEMLLMRDAAHKRLGEMSAKGLKLPVDLKNKIIFYAAPANTPEGMIVGSIGPTTSARMDGYLEATYSMGVVATVGKGKRSLNAVKLCKKYKKPYFVAPSGSSAAMATRIKKIEIIAFEDLAAEAIYRIEAVNFPLLVAIDSLGNDIFREN